MTEAGEIYDTDILDWSERQAALLRRVAAGEPVNERPDWANIIEEVAEVGAGALRAVRSHLLQLLLHDLKAAAWPSSANVPHWRSEARVARIIAADAYTASMRSKIDVPAIYAKALHAMPETVDDQPPLPVPESCPVTLGELLGEPRRSP